MNGMHRSVLDRERLGRAVLVLQTVPADEYLAYSFANTSKPNVIIARLFNTIGPNQTGKYGMVVPNFVHQAVTNKPVTIFGDGTQRRAFSYIGDILPCLWRAAFDNIAARQTINLGGIQPVTINAAAARAERFIKVRLYVAGGAK